MKKYQIFCMAMYGDYSLDGMSFNSEEGAYDYLRKYTDKCWNKFSTQVGIGCDSCMAEFTVEENNISVLRYLWLKLNRKIKS